MKDFDWTTFSRKIAIKSPVKTIYDAWTKVSEIERWFLRTCRYFDNSGHPIDRTVNVEKDSGYEWTWYLYDVTEKGKITQANHKDHIQFTFVGCLVDVIITDMNGFSMVELIQKNIPVDEVSKKEIRLACDSGWSFFLVNLKSIYEGGIDLRNKITDFKGLLNN